MSETQHYEVMTIYAPLAGNLTNLCQELPLPLQGEFKGGSVIFDEEVHFSDKHFMVVQVIASEDPYKEPCWTQGVLFNEQGRECGMTEPGEEFLGEYRVDNYCVNVEIEDE